MEEILPNIYTFQVELPQSPLRAINLYVIKDNDRIVLFDTGFNRPECQEQLLDQLAYFEKPLEDFELVLTHMHSDHTGLTHLFADKDCPIYTSKIDGDIVNAMAEGSYWDMMLGFRDLYGMEKDEITIEDNPGYRYRLRETFDYQILTPGDTFEIGDYQFTVLDLKGHTPGHIGFYEANKGFILSGDTVLDPMTPNITYWGENEPNILQSYISTLSRLKELNLNLMLATHRKPIDTPNQRIDELIEHHQERLQEIIDVMKTNQDYTVRDVAKQISWRIKADHWDDFPKGQKWFAAGETLAHLDYLYHHGFIQRTEQEGTFIFRNPHQSIDIPLPVGD